MRIGFDATVLAQGTRYTGTGQYAEKLIRALTRLAPSEEFLLFGEPPEEPVEPLPANVTWVPLPRLPFGRLSAAIGHLLLLPRIVRKNQLDVLHVPGVHTRASLPPIPRRLPCPLVVTVHDLIPMTYYGRYDQPLPWRLRTFYRWNLRSALKAQRIITVSESSRNEMVQWLGLTPSQVAVVHNGIDPAWQTPMVDSAWTAPHGDSPYILFGGSFEPRKNLSRLLRAFQRAVDSGIPHHLIMVVEKSSPHAPPVMALANSLRAAGRLHFLSELNEPTLRTVYRKADAFVFPSLSEGFGLPPLQALASGLPVIASDIPVMREILNGAVAYFDPKSVDDITRALIAITCDQRLRQQLRESGPDQASNFTWETAASLTLDVYRSTMPSREK
jgi:glycosyltransferase involved in cell wall biosynthesis